MDVIASLHVFALLVNGMWSSVDATCGISGFALNNHELHGASQPGNQTRKLKDSKLWHNNWPQQATRSNSATALLLFLDWRHELNKRPVVALSNTTTLLAHVREANN